MRLFEEKEDKKIKLLSLMPFSDEFNDVYAFIKLAAQKIEANCIRIDHEHFGETVLERLRQQLRDADIIIADLTNKNPNVFYEIGFAHGSDKKHVFLITQNDKDVPFDLSVYQYITYDRDKGLDKLRFELEKKFEYAYEKMRMRPTALLRIFGPKVNGNPINVFLPLYEPLTTDDFSEGESFMSKGGVPVPMYSPAFSKEDLQAYQVLNLMFNSQQLGPLRFLGDNAFEGAWRDNHCDICIGGPRSNHMTHYMLNNFDSAKAMLSIIHPEGALDKWRLKLNRRGNVTLRTKTDAAIGIILRINNPHAPLNTITAIFGDRAESTLGAAQYLNKNFRELANEVPESGNDDLMVLLSFTGDRLKRARKLAIINRKDEPFWADEEIERFIVRE